MRKRALGWHADIRAAAPEMRGSAMPNKPSVKPASPLSPSVPAFWPMAMAAALVEEGTELYAKNLEFAEEEIKIHDELRPKLATPNEARLDLRTMVLRDYGKPGGMDAGRRALRRPLGDDRRLS